MTKHVLICKLFTAFRSGKRLTEELAVEELTGLTINDNTPVIVLIPSVKGRGQCSLALISYLCQVQNNFMEEFSRIIGQKYAFDICFLEYIKCCNG